MITSRPITAPDDSKRRRVLERLAQPDASSLSDRAIARECAVSQPFVSALRKSQSVPPSPFHEKPKPEEAPLPAGETATSTLDRGAAPLVAQAAERDIIERARAGHRRLLTLAGSGADVRTVDGAATAPPERATTAGEALRRFHDEHSPLGRVRRICEPVDEDDGRAACACDFDPWT